MVILASGFSGDPAAMGMTAVILSIIALLVSFIVYREMRKGKKPAAGSITVPMLSTDVQKGLNPELIAVITACIAASLNTPVDSLVVRKVKKVPAWRNMSVFERHKAV